MSRHKLKNAPLQEVIFELFWKLPLSDTGQPTDQGFDLAQGVFARNIRKRFPVQKRLIPESMPFKIYPALHFQFWTDEQTWPVVQLGPGLLTVNDTEKNYTWKGNFRENIMAAVETLKESYEGSIEIKQVRLRYIDAVEYDPSAYEISEFVAKFLNVNMQNRYSPAARHKDLNIVQAFDLDNDTVLRLITENGIFNATGNPAIVWATEVEKSININFDNLYEWLEFGHQVVSDAFVNTLNPKFYASFDN